MKKTITIMAVFLLLSMNTVFAAEYPSQVSYNLNNGIFEVRKTYEMQVDEEPSAQAKQSFEQDGYSFVLTDMLRQELPEQQSKEYTETVTVSSESKELTAILPLLADTKAVTTEDGFTGTLKLDTGSITVEPAGYKNNSWTVSATRTYPNLSEADLSLIPKGIEDNGKSLTLADVQWAETSEAGADGAVTRYTATAKYTGTTSSTYATGYTVTADYTGQVSKTNCSVLTYTAIFGSMEVPEAQTDPAPTNTPSSENSNGATAEIDIKQPLLIGGAVLLLTAGGVFLFKRYKGRS